MIRPTSPPAPSGPNGTLPTARTTPTATAPVRGQRPGPSLPDPVWSVSLHREPQDLAALGTEWDDLVDRCSSATPFQCHAWLDSWWRAYGSPGRLRLVLVRHDGRLVGAAPLMVRHLPLPRLVPLGAGISDFGDILLDDDHADGAAALLARALALHRPWSLLDLRELRPGAAAHRLVPHARGAVRRLPDSLCQHLPGVPVEQFLGRLPAHSAKRTRTKLRRVAASGVAVRLTSADEVAGAIADLVRLHELQWRGRGVNPEHLSERFAAHLTRAVTAMTAADRAVVRQYRLDGELIACHLTFLGADFTGLYLYGVHPKARERLDIAGMLLSECLEHAALTGRTEVSLLRGTEPYKQRWRPEQTWNERLFIGGAPLVAVYGGAVRLRGALVGRLRSRLPWLARLRNRVRGLLVPR